MQNVNGSVQQQHHFSVNPRIPVSQLKTIVVTQMFVKLQLLQNSKQKSTVLSFSVMQSTPPQHTSVTRLQKLEVQQLTPTSLHSSLSERVLHIQQHSTPVPTLLPVSTVP